MTGNSHHLASDSIEQLIEAWDGEVTALHFHVETGTWMVIAVHSVAGGPAAGGCRVKVYPSPAAAVRDAHRLSAAMTRKFAVCGIPLGGGKSVIAVPSLPTGHDRAALLHAFGDFVESLGGLYSAAPDMNTSDVDMDVIGERSSYVFCRTAAAGGSGSTAPATADGVYHGIRATLGHVFGTDDPAGRRVVIQGAGAVGARLARLLASAGADVAVCDVDPGRAADVAVDVSAKVIDPEAWATEPCDVLAPCAVGGILDATVIDQLQCRAVAGAANNQLAVDGDAERLRSRGIVWAPDYVINSGGVLHGAGIELLHWSRDELDARIRAIGDTLATIYRTADTDRTTTLVIAERLANERLNRRG